MVSRSAAAGVGVLADMVLREPALGSFHPVSLFGAAMKAYERRLYGDDRRHGVAHALAGVSIGVAAGAVVQSTALATSVTVAGRALGEAALDVERALAVGDLDRARTLLPALVGRDPTS